MKKVTSSDVAKLAGVSQASVSLILNDSPKIKFNQETRERVFATAKELGYEPPLRSKQEKITQRIILLFTPTLTNHYYTEIVQFVQEYADSLGYHVLVCNTFRKVEIEKYYLDTFLTSQVAGIIYTFLPNFPLLMKRVTQKVPTVMIGEKRDNLNICCIGLNNVNAGQMLADHLCSLGHRKLAFVSTPLNQWTLARTQRIEGIRKALTLHGISNELDVLVEDYQEHDISHDGLPYEFMVGRRLTARFLEEGHDATALIGVNDMTALGIMEELQSRGFHVPRDYSVCGFDDIFSSRITTPGLTTVDHHLRARCQAAVDIVVGNTDGQPAASGVQSGLIDRIEYTSTLMIRESTAAPKRSKS